MLLSTAIPIVIAAIVIVIMSNGIFNKPIIPKIKKAAIKFGTTPINDKEIFLKRIKNIEKINNYEETVDKCHRTVGIAILNTSITIVFGFSILVLSNFIPTIYFGFFTGIAMLLAMISVLTLLPKLLIIFKPFDTEKKSAIE